MKKILNLAKKLGTNEGKGLMSFLNDPNGKISFKRSAAIVAMGYYFAKAEPTNMDGIVTCCAILSVALEKFNFFQK